MALETRLRAEEAYYDMSKITDKLYAQSKNGNNFYKLYELIISEDNILLAYRNIKRNTGSNTKGTDGKTVKDYANIPMDELVSLVRSRLANFQPMSVRRVFIPKTNGKERPLGILMLSRLVDTFFSRTSWTMLLYAENHSISVA